MSQPIKRVLEFDQALVVALYDPQSGMIAHMHTVTMFKGGRLVSESEAIETAHKEAASYGHRVAELKTKVSSNYAHCRHCNRIDPETGEFLTSGRCPPA
jgi:hypothetical protein